MSKNHCKKRVEVGQKSYNPNFRNFFKREFQNRIYDQTKGSIYTKIQSLLNSSIFYNLTNGISTLNLEQEVRN